MNQSGVPGPREDRENRQDRQLLRTADPADITWERLQDQIGWYDRKSGTAQQWFKRLKLATLALAAGLPVAVAASAPSWTVALMGALVAVIEGAQQLYKYQENWIGYRSVCEALRHEQYLYLAHAGPYGDPTAADTVLAERVEALTSQENTQWAQVTAQPVQRPAS
ncbi:DUF4231 domain-containing protein [Streptomyces sp. MST-110588]|uniref:DUF4231 domain-containing protein n=1 Tax=Streptomyces sp. MST-110588 TaxID=2833628 RepID=UPI001F5DEC6C|nr:DUF4231 domain-containing protein [Streptomyces sp. MST-110588]UNO38652.1 DUF4231 domain-containing protein [Streptomyces sp. MST-110588]